MSSGPYAGLIAVLATRHAKEEVIAPAFRTTLGLEVVVSDIDTDTFGTFDGRVPRTASPQQTALSKAHAGMARSGHRLGLASEGSIGPDSALPFVNCDVETIVFVDGIQDIVVSETFRSTHIIAHRTTVQVDADLTEFLAKADFPRHGLIVHSQGDPQAPAIKGITDTGTLMAAIREASIANGCAVIENDFRACFSPSRMRNIRECAERLAQRLATPCPECGAPGWGPIAPVRGLPCADCGEFIDSAIQADQFGCPACPATRLTPRPEQSLSPQWCPRCNP